ncbi:hypothetical protein Q4517_05535 [Tenacibaculum sp. 1_MG-2023]|uniref:hypothetical protein n=1 Tax=Tenacibaculum sp. 1_MG-2023 TaxID=3062653 RepID=UPI0026E11D40|nr:hypothetical protein [Tenacibaculum sp. 1_MG-2023]MDO6675006.1 hypothetical protein [Tenacibaculum sp. 1_MG-2023]
MDTKKKHLNSLHSICKLLFKSQFTPDVMSDLEAIFYNRKKCTLELEYPDWEHTTTEKITFFITEKLEALELIYVNDYAFDYFDALDIYTFFHQEEIPYPDDEYDQEPDESDVYNYLNSLFKKHHQKVLIIDTNADDFIFLPIAFSDITKLNSLCLQQPYFKVSDVIEDTSIPVKDAFELLPLLYHEKQDKVPRIFTDRSISYNNFFRILNSYLLKNRTSYWFYNNLEEQVEILKDDKDEFRSPLKRLFSKPKKTYLIEIKNKDEESSLLWDGNKTNELFIQYTLATDSQYKQQETQQHFINNSNYNSLLLKPDNPLQLIWERTLRGLENLEFYYPQIDSKKLRKIISDDRFATCSYEEAHRFPNQPFEFYVRHLNQENVKEDILPMLGIKVGLDMFYYKSYSADYLVFFSKENDEMELILSNQSERYFWAVKLFNELYNNLYANNIAILN